MNWSKVKSVVCILFPGILMAALGCCWNQPNEGWVEDQFSLRETVVKVLDVESTGVSTGFITFKVH